MYRSEATAASTVESKDVGRMMRVLFEIQKHQAMQIIDNS